MFLSDGQPVPSTVDTIADRTPLFADANYYASDSLQLSGIWAAYAAIYKNQIWVNILVRKLAFGTARLPFEVKRTAGAGAELVDPADPLVQLLTRPNARLDGFRLWLWTISTFDIYGEAFWLKLRDQTGRVRELHPMHPTNTVIRRNPDGTITYYYTFGVRNVSELPPIPEEDVVPFLSYNPDNIARGLSNLEPLRQTLLNEDASRRATASWWQRGARPSVALTSPNKLSDDAAARLKKRWEATHAGADNMGGTAVLEEGLIPTILQLSSQEMQYIDSRKLNREEVCAAYDVPPPVVHILDKATFSNITEQMRSMYRDTMGNRLPLFESALAHHLTPEFDGSGATFGRFNMDDVLRGDFENRASSVSKLIPLGVMKPSEARPMFGLDPGGPEADELYANAALLRLGSSAAKPPPTGVDGNPVPQPVERPPAPRRLATPPQLRAIMGRLGRAKANATDLRKQLVSEHQRQLTEFVGRQSAAAQVAVQAKDAGLLDTSEWDDDLTAVLLALAQATSKTVGDQVAAKLGAGYDPDSIADWLTGDAGESAARINQKTAEDLAAAVQAAGDDPDVDVDPLEATRHYFGALDGRVAQIAASRVAIVGGLASQSAAGQGGAKTKTWVTGPNPRADHAAMDGQTVGLGELFSNGLNGPGDPAGGADEVAGCNCELSFSTEA